MYSIIIIIINSSSSGGIIASIVTIIITVYRWMNICTMCLPNLSRASYVLYGFAILA